MIVVAYSLSRVQRLWPHGLQPARLLCLWDFPGKNTGVSCHFLLQGSSVPRDRTRVSFIAGEFITDRSTREACLPKELPGLSSQRPLKAQSGDNSRTAKSWNIRAG